MKVVRSYAVEIRKLNKIFRKTIKIYNDAITFCIEIFEKEWETLKNLSLGNKEQYQYADRIIHSTKSNKAKYGEFDKRFYKMPSYLRIAVINTALGYLNSYHSNLDNWYKNGCKGTKPTLQKHLNKLPVFYKDGMYKNDVGGNCIRLKLFHKGDWVWIKVQLKKTDLESIRKHFNKGTKLSVPMLERRNKKWFLRFSLEDNVKLEKKDYKEQRILAVDLGINTDATCSVMESDGTILARKFVNNASDKDLIGHTLNKIKKIQQRYGSKQNTKKLWRYVKFHNEELARKIAKKIVEIANEYECDVIVFEHLEMKGRKRGSKKQRLQLWKCRSIQDKVELQAHLLGKRISRVNPYNTSRLAYDGTGKVQRGKEADLNTYSMCKFQSGKEYNCDLNASYNIGARYYIREIEKSTSVRKWSDIKAEVPECQKRTRCTYDTLLSINKVLIQSC